MRRTLSGAAALAAAALLAAGRAAAQASPTVARADSAYDAGNRALAESLYDRAVAEDSSSRALYRLALLRRERPREAIPLLRAYVAREPGDAWGHMALGDALARSGDRAGARAAYATAARLAPGEREIVEGRARVDRLSSGTAPTFEPTVGASEDSDRNRALRLGVGIGSQVSDRTRFRGEGALTRVSDLAGEATTGETRLGLRFIPRAGVVVEPSLGATILAAPADTVIRYTRRPPRLGGGWQANRQAVPGGSTAVPTGELRVRWRAPHAGPALRAAARRSVLTASPLLVSSRVVRDEGSALLETPLVGALRARAGGSIARLASRTDTRTRHAIDGALAVRARPWLELSLQGHTLGVDSLTTAGYFSPERADLGEVGASVEWESPRGVALSLDAGAGAQRVKRFEEPVGDWTRALRLWGAASYPLAPGRGLRAEIEAYDSLLGSVAGTAEGWRYGSVSLGAWVSF